MDFEINDLPLEVLTKIFTFLPDHELLRCTFVCKNWYLAARDPFFYKKLTLQSSDSQKYVSFIETFDKADIFPFKHVYIASACNELKRMVEYCKQRCSTIKHLHVWINSYRDLTGLDAFKNVQLLEISPRLLLRRDNEGSLPFDFRMESVKILQLNENLMSISITETLINRFPNLKKVILGFDPHGDSVSAFQVLLPRLKALVEKTSHIQFIFNDLDRPKKINRNGDELLKFFIENPMSNLIINRLWLWLPKLSLNLLPFLVENQRQIKILPIHVDDRLNNELMESIGTNFKNLEVIKVEAIRKWNVNNFLNALEPCSNLNTIQLCFGTLDQNGEIHLCDIKKLLLFHKMRSLTVRYTSLEFDISSMEIALMSFPFLTELEFLSCDTVNDSVVQLVIRYCRGLKVLKLIACTEITDDGLTGETPCQTLLEGVSLKLLSHLEVLSLSKCSKISNKSLVSAFKFKSLKGLDLTGLDKINEIGIAQVTIECPFIEKFKLDGCKSITNRAVQMLTRNLPLLKFLYLNQCPHLTEECLSGIMEKCKNIQRLEIVLPNFPKSRRTIHYFKMGIFHIMHCTREGHLAYTPPEYCEEYLNSRLSGCHEWRY